MKRLKELIITLCGLVLVTSCNVAISGISVYPESFTLEVGGSIYLSVTIRPDDATNKNVVWSSSDPSVATVDAAGKVTGVKTGSAVITVTSVEGAMTAKCAIEVYVPATGMTLNKNSLDMKVGESVTLIATVLPENATDKEVVWSSTEPSVASVDNNGKVTALKAGMTFINVRIKNGIGYMQTCIVEVTNNPS